jgi:hypothetical protein
MWINMYGLTNTPLTLSLRNDIIKIDVGTLIIEMDKKGFVSFIESLLIQASNLGINLSTTK